MIGTGVGWFSMIPLDEKVECRRAQKYGPLHTPICMRAERPPTFQTCRIGSHCVCDVGCQPQAVSQSHLTAGRYTRQGFSKAEAGFTPMWSSTL